MLTVENQIKLNLLMYEYYKANKRSLHKKKFYFGLSTLYKFKHRCLLHLTIDISYRTSHSDVTQIKVAWHLYSLSTGLNICALVT